MVLVSCLCVVVLVLIFNFFLYFYCFIFGIFQNCERKFSFEYFVEGLKFNLAFKK